MGQDWSQTSSKKALRDSRPSPVLPKAGDQVEMEDRHITLMSLTPGVFLSAVFDGHGGAKTAEFAANHTHQMIKEISSHIELKRTELKWTFPFDPKIKTDRLISQKVEECSGSTACAILIDSDQIYCSNIGDSRAIASIGGHVCPLSFDHKPNRRDELKRIESGGGWVEFNRVNGALAMSRALGDFFFKQNIDRQELSPLHKQIVTAIPDVIICKQKELEFLVLACDGVFDMMTNTEVIKFVRNKLAQKIHPKEICQRLLEVCIAEQPSTSLPGCDNVTVTIIFPTDIASIYKKCAKPKNSKKPALAMSDSDYAAACGENSS
ncbi:unnamed protein product [Oikopleura dioica]|uniref:protein-serine/threonine phosphatase n=1 Tax=Oikopleura dioica TaxID=34765 RepID=E4YLH6_OIKDI|nr:unnamed protein product [Oikopleura dioica]